MSLFGWMLGVSYLALLFRHRERAIGPFLIPFVILFSAVGLLLPMQETTPDAEMQGTLFALHVTLGMLGYAAFTFSFVLSILYLIQNRQIRSGRTGLLFRRLPPLEVIGRMNRTSVSIGLGVLAGSDLLRPPLGEPLLDDAERSEDRVRDPDARPLRLPPLDGAPGMEGPACRDSVDLRLRPRSLFLYGRQHVLQPDAHIPMSPAAEARLLLYGWNFRVTDAAVRNRIAFTADEVKEGLRSLVARGIVSESVIVSTCHRSEIYGLFGLAHAEGERDGDPDLVTRFLSEWRGLEARELARTGFRREGADAARHLFRVASGLDSMALGESEVLGQVRGALALAKESGSTRAVLHRLFESALAAGKRVRAETEIARHPLSVVSIGFELATKVFGDLAERTVLVLGAGEAGSLFARQAVEAGVRDIRIANRTFETAEAVANRVRGVPIHWDDYIRELASADVVVGTTASPRPVVRRDDVENAIRQRRGRPMFFLDLAVPPDVDPAARDIYNAFVYGVNDLELVAEENRKRRAKEIPRAEAVLEEELARFLGWMGNLAVVPTVSGLRARFDRIRDEELARIPEADRERFRAFADSLAARTLHEPMRRLKSEPDASRRLDRVEAVRHLFDLEEDS